MKANYFFSKLLLLAAIFYGSIEINAQSFSAGQTHAIYTCDTGIPMGVGEKSFGKLGDGSFAGSANLPVQATGITDVIGVAAGGDHTLYLKNDGTVWSVGYNSNGQLGIGNTISQNSIVQISSLSGIINIAAGVYHSLFLKNDGTVWAVGSNNFGQLGDGTTIDKTTPFQITSLSGIIAISAGQDHSLFLKNDGTVWSTGYNFYGQLGDGTLLNRSTPVQVNVVNGITDISAGFGAWHSLF